MDASIVTQLDERRKRRAMTVAARMHGKPGNGRIDGDVGSAAVIYNPDTRTVIGCLNSKCRTGSPDPCPDCVHALAGRYYLAAQDTVVEQARRQEITLNVAYSRLCSQAERAPHHTTRMKLQILRQAARYLVVWEDSEKLTEQQHLRAYGRLQAYLNTPRKAAR